jgi:hypothetical protein
LWHASLWPFFEWVLLMDAENEIGEAITDAVEQLRDLFESRLEPTPKVSNLVDVVDDLHRSVRAVAHAITPVAAPGHDPDGGVVTSLTEAVMGISFGLRAIAEAIADLADAVRSKK